MNYPLAIVLALAATALAVFLVFRIRAKRRWQEMQAGLARLKDGDRFISTPPTEPTVEDLYADLKEKLAARAGVGLIRDPERALKQDRVLTRQAGLGAAYGSRYTPPPKPDYTTPGPYLAVDNSSDCDGGGDGGGD